MWRTQQRCENGNSLRMRAIRNEKNTWKRTEIRHIHHIHTHSSCILVFLFPFYAHSIHRHQLIITIACVVRDSIRRNISEMLFNQNHLSPRLVFLFAFFTSLSIWLLSYLQFAQMLHPSDGVLRYTSSPNIFSPTRTRASARALLSRSLGQW